MSEEFVKPKKVTTDVTAYINALLAGGLEKDLHENEEICETCQGTGLVKSHTRYGLRNDPDKTAGHFPYQHQYLTFCPNCYTGIVHRCEYCGKIMPRAGGICTCDGATAIRRQEEDEKLLDALKKAEEFDSDALGSRFGMCYSENYCHGEGYFAEWEDFFDSLDDDNDDSHPEYVWGTIKTEMSLNADSIIENAIDDFYEDAGDQIGDAARVELQQFLNDWCERFECGPAYTWTTKYKVRIPWEKAGVQS